MLLAGIDTTEGLGHIHLAHVDLLSGAESLNMIRATMHRLADGIMAREV